MGSDTSDDEPGSPSPIPAKPPSLPLINTVGDIELPSRIGSEKSRKSRKGQRSTLEDVPAVPAIPRKSSRRHSSRDLAAPSASLTGPAELSSIQGSPNQQRGSQATMKSASRLPFTNVQASPSKVNRHSMGGDSVASDYMHVGDEENAAPVSYTQHLRQTSSALGSHAFDDPPSRLDGIRGKCGRGPGPAKSSAVDDRLSNHKQHIIWQSYHDVYEVIWRHTKSISIHCMNWRNKRLSGGRTRSITSNSSIILRCTY